MRSKTMIVPEKKRVLAPPFAWIDRRYLFDGFLSQLSPKENLLYFFLVLAADRDGVSFYSYDKICTMLKLDADDYIRARDGLVQKHLIAFDGRQFQVLALPGHAPKSQARPQPPAQSKNKDAEALGAIFARLAQQHQSQRFEAPDRDLA